MRRATWGGDEACRAARRLDFRQRRVHRRSAGCRHAPAQAAGAVRVARDAVCGGRQHCVRAGTAARSCARGCVASGRGAGETLGRHAAENKMLASRNARSVFSVSDAGRAARDRPFQALEAHLSRAYSFSYVKPRSCSIPTAHVSAGTTFTPGSSPARTSASTSATGVPESRARPLMAPLSAMLH